MAIEMLRPIRRVWENSTKPFRSSRRRHPPEPPHAPHRQNPSQRTGAGQQAGPEGHLQQEEEGAAEAADTGSVLAVVVSDTQAPGSLA